MDLPQRTDELIAKCKKISTVKHVYFEPPKDMKMEYPCIRISRVNADTRYANNRVYNINHRYRLVFITREPDSKVVDEILWTFEKIRLDNSSTADNLHHDYYTIYF